MASIPGNRVNLPGTDFRLRAQTGPFIQPLAADNRYE